MRHFFVLLIAAIIPSVVIAESPVYFADANLKTAVEAELGITDPNATDMLELTYLDASSKGIVDPNGIQYAVNLTILWLSNNNISDINSLSEMGSMEELYLYSNNVSDISALSGMSNLTNLWLNDNNISDISALSEMGSMEELYLHFNNISDINSLPPMTDLTILFLSDNNISNISVLSGMTSMTILHFSNNNISDISALSVMGSMTTLSLYLNNISDISTLSGMTNLSGLYLHFNPLDCPAYDTYIPIIEANNPGIFLIYDPRPESCIPLPDIDVSPVVYDFGDVILFSSRSVLLTISNMGNSDLTINSIDFTPGSNEYFEITSPPALPFTIAPEDSDNIEITFSPVTKDIFYAALEISSDDTDEPVVQVDLVGAGVTASPPVQIAEILDLIETSVADGTIVGEGKGKSADKKLNALINMFEATNDLIAGEYYDDACGQLINILKKCDGQIPPPDFISGQAVEELVDRILLLMEDIGCE